MQLGTIFQSLQQGILLCDANARILYFNEAYGEFIGQKLDEVKGRPITDFRPHALVAAVIRSGEAKEGVGEKPGILCQCISADRTRGYPRNDLDRDHNDPPSA